MEAMLVEQRRLEEALKRNGEDAKRIQGQAGEIEQAEIEREEKIIIEEQKERSSNRSREGKRGYCSTYRSRSASSKK